ncbi:unnamed protein product [Arabidopsis halleri]
MKSVTFFVVSCVLMVFVMHYAKVEAAERAPVLVEFIPGYPCDVDIFRSAGQCRIEIRDDYYPHCDCRDAVGGHQCTCVH